MYYYFHSDSPCALKINGVFYGILSNGVKSINIEFDMPFLELCPVSVNEPCVNLLLDDNFLSSPHEAITITDLKGGYLIKFNPIKKTQEFSIIAQQKFNDAIVTIFSENGIKLSIETRNDFYAESYPLNVKTAQIKEFQLNNERFIAICLENDKNHLCIYKMGEKIQKVFCREVLSFSCENEFSTIEKFNDIAKHEVNTLWEYNGSRFIANTVKIKSSIDLDFNIINEKLIPYCFLEGILVGENCDNLLCGNVLENKHKLKGFLGDFIGVMPPPTKFRDIEEVGLVYRKSENLYFVEYFKFTLENKKISNITKCD